MEGSFAAFLAISAIVIITPGQDTALTIRNTLLGGRAAGIGTAVGVGIGQATWTLAASLGLTALLVSSEPAFAAVRIAGAIYLLYLGAHALWLAVRPGPHPDDGRAAPREQKLPARTALRQGALSNLGNPKMAIFFSSLLPQFVRAGPDAAWAMVGLGLVFVTMTLVWLSAYAAVVARAGDVLRRPRVRRAVDATMGAILIAFGGRLAVERR